MKKQGWTTANEIAYVNNIGVSKNDSGMLRLHAASISKQEILRNYIDAALKRGKWGDIDKYKVISYAANLLNQSHA